MKFNFAYDFLIQDYKKDLEQKLIRSIKKILFENNIMSAEYLRHLKESQFNLDIFPEEIKYLIKIIPIYKDYSALVQSLQKNEFLQKKCKLEQF